MPDPIPTQRQRRRRQHEAVIEDILAIARTMMQADGVAALNFNANVVWIADHLFNDGF